MKEPFFVGIGMGDSDTWVTVTFVGSFDRPGFVLVFLLNWKKCEHLWPIFLRNGI